MNLRYLYTSFDGRINRKPFWLGIIVLIAIAIVLSLVVIGPMNAASPTLAPALGLILSLALLYPGFALGVKRLHDRNQSGQWMIVFVAPGIISQIGALLHLTVSTRQIAGQEILVPNALGTLLGLVSLAVAIWAFVVLGCLKGTAGSNAYGADPLGANNASATAAESNPPDAGQA